MTISLKKQHNAHSAQAQPLQTHHSGIKLEISDFQTIIKISRQSAIKKSTRIKMEVSKTSQESSWKSTENPTYQTASNTAKAALSGEAAAPEACIFKSH